MQQVLDNRNLKSLKVTFDELRQIVQENDKQRFTMVPVAEAPEGEGGVTTTGQTPLASSDAKDYMIRANQGHSLKVEAEGLLKPITSEDVPETAVHGTTHAAWPLIETSGGLKPMGRNHVHFASGLPAGFKSVVESNNDVAAPVISGMRKSSTVLMFLDIAKAMEAGIKFWLSDNGVILTEGNDEAVVPLEFFKRVEDRTGEGVLLEDGKIVKQAPSKWTSKGSGKT